MSIPTHDDERSAAIRGAYERLIQASLDLAGPSPANTALRLLPTLRPEDQARVLVALIGVTAIHDGPIFDASMAVLEAAAR